MSHSVREIQDWMVLRLSDLTGTPAQDIDVREPILRYGLDSVALVVFAGDLEDWLGIALEDNPLHAHPTIEALAKFLAEHQR